MRWLAVIVLLGACGGQHPPPVVGGVSLVLDIPNGVLDPKGFTTVEVVLHEPSGDIVRSAKVNTDGTFDLGALDPNNMVSVEATLRNDSGALSLIELDGATVRATGSIGATDPSWHVQATADFNGDGRADILLRNDADVLRLIEMDGFSVVADHVIGATDSTWHVVAHHYDLA